MELWIKTQEKRLVQIVDFLEPRESENGETYHLWGFSLIGSFIKLGFYKDEERALEVLDEIQRILTPMYQFDKNNKDITVQVNKWDYYVYEMPQE